MQVFDGLFDAAVLPEVLDVLIKLGIGAVIGGAIGYEREVSGRPAGIRTHMLMVIGVVLFCEVSRAFAPHDEARIAAQILTGVGFLGAGTILRIGAEIKGLTSAASIWAAAALGMAVSVGGAFLWIAIAGTILCLITLAVVDGWERKLIPHSHVRVLQAQIQSVDQVGDLIRAATSAGAEVQSVEFVTRETPLVVSMSVHGAPDRILAAVAACSGVTSAHWTG